MLINKLYLKYLIMNITSLNEQEVIVRQPPIKEEPKQGRSWVKTALIVGLVLAIVLIPAIAYVAHAYASPSPMPQPQPPPRPINCAGPVGNGTCIPLNALQAKVDRLAWKEKLVVEPPVPTSTAPIMKEEGKKWVNAHCTKSAKKAAQKLLDVTQHVTHSEFEEELSKSVSQFNNWLACQPSKDYVLLVTSKAAHKSNRWMAELALKYFDVLPVNVINMVTDNYELTPDLLEFSKAHPEVKHYVFLDDASYSGTQAKKFACELSNMDLRNECDRYGWKCDRKRIDQILKTEKKHNVITIIPYMRDPEAIKMNSPVTTSCLAVPEVSDHIHVFSSNKMVPLRERMDHEDLNELKRDNPLIEDNIPIYFDHKVADFLSVPANIYQDGKVARDSNGGYCQGNNIKFIPPINPPYK